MKKNILSKLRQKFFFDKTGERVFVANIKGEPLIELQTCLRAFSNFSN